MNYLLVFIYLFFPLHVWAGPIANLPAIDSIAPVFNAGARGVLCDGSTNDTAAIQAVLASCNSAGGGEVVLPRGTCLISSANGILINGSNCTLRGQGPSTILSGTTISNVIATSGSFLTVNFTIRDLKILTGTTGGINVSGDNVRGLTIDNVDFDSSAGSGQGILLQGLDGVVVKNSRFYGDGDGVGKGISTSRGIRHLKILNNEFDYLSDGITIDGGTAGEERSSDIEISGNRFDLGWWLLKSVASNSGGTVTYAAGTLTDTAASFSSLSNRNVRVMATKQASGGTVSYFSGTKVTDASADFVTAAIAKGDIIRTSTKFSVVTYVEDADELWVEGWRDSTTYRPTTAPTANTAYTVYGVKIGYIASHNATVLTLGTTSANWLDFTGATSTPSSGTLYEVLSPKPNYPILLEAGVQNVKILNNTIRRGWSDQIGTQSADQVIIQGNHVLDGQDVGITANGSRITIANNTIEHQGTIGISLAATDSIVEGNQIYNTTWTNTVNTTYLAGIVLNVATRNTIANNKIDGGTSALNRYGISFTGASIDNVLSDNTTRGHSTGGLRFNSSSTTGTRILKNNLKDTTPVSTVASVSAMYEDTQDFTFALLPTNSSTGSRVRCSDCNATCTAGSSSGKVCVSSSGTWGAAY